MGFEVSNLKLANPFGSPQNSRSAGSPNIVPSIMAAANITSNSSNHSTSNININNINIITSNTANVIMEQQQAQNEQNEQDVASPACLYDENNGTMVVHADQFNNENMVNLTERLSLQREGSSDQRDETNAVFPPPHISESDKTNELHQLSAETENKQMEEKQSENIQIKEQNPLNSDQEVSENDIEQKQDKKRKSVNQDEVVEQTKNLLRLQYDNTTLQSEDSSEESQDDNKPMVHAELYREESRWKWKKKEVLQNQQAMQDEMEKLQMEQEIAAMNAAMNRMQSGAL